MERKNSEAAKPSDIRRWHDYLYPFGWMVYESRNGHKPGLDAPHSRRLQKISLAQVMVYPLLLSAAFFAYREPDITREFIKGCIESVFQFEVHPKP